MEIISNQSEKGWVLKGAMENNGTLLLCNWSLSGEIELDLALHTLEIVPCFELARYLDDLNLPPLLVRDPEKAREAVEQVEQRGKYTDIIWKGYTPEALEDYLGSSHLPLPIGYKEFWSIIDSQLRLTH